MMMVVVETNTRMLVGKVDKADEEQNDTMIEKIREMTRTIFLGKRTLKITRIIL